MMTLADALDQIERFRLNQAPTVRLAVSKPYHVARHWGQPSDPGIPFADDNGVYMYVAGSGRVTDEVLYVGKANQRDPGGLGKRASGHIQPYTPKTTAPFSRHDWVDDTDVDPTVKRTIADGRFSIVTVRVEPSDQAENLELVLLVWQGDELPPLNKRVG